MARRSGAGKGKHAGTALFQRRRHSVKQLLMDGPVGMELQRQCQKAAAAQSGKGRGRLRRLERRVTGRWLAAAAEAAHGQREGGSTPDGGATRWWFGFGRPS